MSYQHYAFFLVIIFLAMAGSGPSAASISSEKINPTLYPLADEQIVNSETSGEQDFPSVAALGPNRGFVVVWQSGQQDSDGTTGIYAQRYDQNGARVIDTNTGLPLEFQVNPEAVGGAQTRPSVAALSGSGFVVTWTSPGPGGATDIYGRRYGKKGKPLGPVFQVSPTNPTGKIHKLSAVAGLASGSFVVTWTSNRTTCDTTGTVTSTGTNIYGQIFNPDGVKIGRTFCVNTVSPPDYAQESSAVTGLAGGGFAVTWESDDFSAGQRNIYMKLFDADGGEESGNVLVNTIPPGAERGDGDDVNPSVAALSEGGFVVTWSDAGNHSVQGKRYDASGTISPHPDTILDDFKIDDQSPFTFKHNDVTGISDGGFVVTWVQKATLTSNIYGRRFSSDGVAIGSLLAVNDSGANPGKNEKFPRVVELGDGTLAFVWVGVDSTSPGITSFGIFSRLFALATPSPEV